MTGLQLRRYLYILLVICSVGLMLCFVSCASKPKSKVTGTKPYTVRGQKYYPLQTADGYDEEGVASWYGPGFHGKLTANGETYNQNALTAAHKLLPLGTTVRVTNLENGKSLVLRINDRGPFVHDRIIDLSKRAAQRLDMYNQGIAKVRVQAISGKGAKTTGKVVTATATAVGASSSKSSKSASSASALAQAKKSRVLNEDGEIPDDLKYLFEEEGSSSSSAKAVASPVIEQVREEVLSGQVQQHLPLVGDFYVQLGEFTVKKLASLMAGKLKDQGYDARSYKEPGQSLWRVRIGPWSSESKAREFLPNFSDFSNATVVWAEPKR